MRSSSAALGVARAYHRGWTSRNVDTVIMLLSPQLEVEVPINAYPTKESFVTAVAAFGALVKQIDVLAELGNDTEAMLLYDMDVERVGRMRVAEHFTVRDGQIRRIRQVHDTVAVRAAGLGS